MSSPLGLTISEFYISHIEDKIFNTIIKKQKKNKCSLLDDIFIATQSCDEIKKQNQTLEKNYVLNFTTELNMNKNPVTMIISLHPHTRNLFLII